MNFSNAPWVLEVFFLLPKGKFSVYLKLSIFFSIALQALLFLCGFVANLPSASCLRCYQCFDYPGSSQPCSNPSVLQCDNSYDSCLSGVLTAEISGSLFTTAIKNCSISQMHCNESLVCGQANSSIAVGNGTLLTCSLNCCYGDLCNYGGAGKNRRLASLYQFIYKHLTIYT